MIYADHAATTMLSNQAKEAMPPGCVKSMEIPQRFIALREIRARLLLMPGQSLLKQLRLTPMKFSSHHAEQNPIIGRYWALHYVFPISGSVSLQAA